MRLAVLGLGIVLWLPSAGGWATPGDACRVVSSSAWQAWVDAMPGMSAPRLIVVGAAVAANGHVAALREGGRNGEPPVVQTVYVTTRRGAGSAAQPLRIEIPALTLESKELSPYRGVRVMCGARQLAFIAPVPLVQ